MIDVVAFGELLIDFTHICTNEDGYPTMAAHPGGAVTNFLAALAKFGTKTALMGKVGNDTFGRLLVSTLNKLGIDASGMILADDVFTTLAFVTLDASGDRSFSFARKPGADTCIAFEELDLSLIDEAKVFHFGTLSLTDEPARSATYQAVNYAKENGKLITFDPNLRTPLWADLDDAKAQILWGLKQADVIKISDNEVEFLFDMSPEQGAAHILDKYGAKLVFVTCGSEGCVFQNPIAKGKVSALRGVKVADTTGAGDIFGGSAIWKLLQIGITPETLSKAQLQEIAEFACTAASLSATKPGGASSVPSLAEVEKYV